MVDFFFIKSLQLKRFKKIGWKKRRYMCIRRRKRHQNDVKLHVIKGQEVATRVFNVRFQHTFAFSK